MKSFSTISTGCTSTTSLSSHWPGLPATTVFPISSISNIPSPIVMEASTQLSECYSGRGDIQRKYLLEVSLKKLKDTFRKSRGGQRELQNSSNEYEGVLVWGAGDNFFRSIENGGPLSGLRNMVVLDRCSQKISIGGETYFTEDPKDGIRRLSWPVVISVSERRKDLKEYVRRIDPNRHVYFV